MEKELGLLALQLLIAGLAITPARRYLRLNLIKFRRALGLLAFIYVSLHLLVWLVLDVGILSQIWADILKRPYITIGMAGFACLVPLAATSNNFSIRKLGATWRKLHRLTYLAAILAGVHFIWLVKGFQIEPLLYMAVIPNPVGGSGRGLCRIRTGGGETIHIRAASLWITRAGVSDAGQ